METVINVNDIQKSYGEFVAVAGLNSDIFEIEIVGLVRPKHDLIA